MRGRIVSTNTLEGRSSSVMDTFLPVVSVTCTVKFAYSSLCVDGTITVALKSYPSMIDVAFNLDSRIETLPEAIVLFTVNSRFRYYHLLLRIRGLNCWQLWKWASAVL